MRVRWQRSYRPMRMLWLCPELTNESGLMVGRGGGHGFLVGLVKSPDLILLAVEDPAFPSAEVHQVQSHRRGVEQRICSTRIELAQFREIKMFGPCTYNYIGNKAKSKKIDCKMTLCTVHCAQEGVFKSV
jgi:hypothetical protein